MIPRALVLAALIGLAACQPGSRSGVPGDAEDHQPFSAILPEEVIHFTGTEPFWGGQAQDENLTYTTPEDSEGQTIKVSRFGGRGGLTLSGELDGEAFDMMVTPGTCSDGMSDRGYPFTVTLKLGEEVRQGCAWSDASPFTGPKNP